jgi:hypothetical protein
MEATPELGISKQMAIFTCFCHFPPSIFSQTGRYAGLREALLEQRSESLGDALLYG